ncbi:flagellar biosynthesis protein FlhB [Spirochaetia bacterium 38H-sp]|uniref:Flagellar biosynthetic protein FlhB n=1 Tax=Rarispira pelagica TaxID=3141764 RepID=A0ABU9UDX5_9SPIR
MSDAYMLIVEDDSFLLDMHLQWFAAEDEGRTEEPTEHKIRKAREEGKVAKTPELPSALVMLFSLILLGVLSQYVLSTAVSMFTSFFYQLSTPDFFSGRKAFSLFIQYFLRLSLPFLIIAFIAAFAGNVIQVGFLFTTKPITPDFQRIVPNFVRFFKKAFFSGEALFNLGKTFLKVFVIGFIAFLNISAEIKRILSLSKMPILESMSFISFIIFRILLESSIVFLVISVVDYIFQRRQHLESLKMSKEEVKEERKMYEGDPLVKSRLRQRMRELLSQNMIRKVPEADVVITNPTHYAVAIEYEKSRMHAPTVIAKGADELALRMRRIAKDADVPVVEHKPLARALYADVDVGDTIPEQYYSVVATVLARVYAMDSSKKQKAI